MQMALIIGVGSHTQKHFPVTKKDINETRPDVIRIQRFLQNAGYYEGRLDGNMTRETVAAIKDFQKDSSLKVDGIVGPKTWRKLKEMENGR
jgi:peptidoglycan hydrolase-like protein with peptidoglycan-binding domain